MINSIPQAPTLGVYPVSKVSFIQKVQLLFKPKNTLVELLQSSKQRYNKKYDQTFEYTRVSTYKILKGERIILDSHLVVSMQLVEKEPNNESNKRK